MITKFKACGMDEIGCFTIEGAIEDCEECERNLRNDPKVESVWFEFYDDEEGWLYENIRL